MANRLKWEYCLKGTCFLIDGDPRYSRNAKKFNSFAEADDAAYKVALEELEATKEALGIRGD